MKKWDTAKLVYKVESAHTKWSLAEGKRRPIKPMESRTGGTLVLIK